MGRALALLALVEERMRPAVRPWVASALCAILALAHLTALELLLGPALALCTPLATATAMSDFAATDLNSKATWFGIQ